ncbi:MAG: endolytic transglycosylase MltG [Clostridia bacterium]|nr:endolytic transglycosylase MltG [Clostridia bacterium]
MDEQNKTPREFDVDAVLASLNQPATPAPSQPEPVPVRPVPQKPQKRKKKKGCSGFMVFVCLCLCAAVAVAGGVLFALCDLSGMGKELLSSADDTVQIQVAEGASVRQIAEDLEEEGILLSRHLFLAYLKLTGKGNNINYGYHDFTPDMGYGAILESLAQPVKAEDVTVTVPSGKTVEQILHLLEEAGVCSYASLRHEVMNGEFDSPLWQAIPDDDAMYYAMEGYLFPDTYHFYPNDDPHRVIQVMLDNLEEKFTPALREVAKQKGYTTHQIMTMASVIELEACGYYDQMPKVSAVFYNRLKQWPAGARLLQSDPTMYYPYGDGAYNTYKIEGLPPGPMSNVTAKAIEAAVYPDETETAFYFVTDKNGGFYFNQTLSAHEATISDLKNKGLWLTTPYFE